MYLSDFNKIHQNNSKMINKHHDGTISLKNLDCNEFVKKKLIFLRNNFSVPNLLISGPPGSGKSTAGKFFWLL